MSFRIRECVFETNSSSMHSICISRKALESYRGRHIDFRLGEFGQINPTLELKRTCDYLYTALMVLDCGDMDSVYMDQLREVLDKAGVTYTFEDTACAAYSLYGFDSLQDFVSELFTSENTDLLLRLLLSDESRVYVGSDNNPDPFDMCFSALPYVYCYDSVKNEFGAVINPKHNEALYEYFNTSE